MLLYSASSSNLHRADSFRRSQFQAFGTHFSPSFARWCLEKRNEKGLKFLCLAPRWWFSFAAIPFPKAMYRTHSCNALRKEHIGQTVTLSGWVNSRRDHGGVIFIDLRDREGLTQVLFDPQRVADSQLAPDLIQKAHGLRGEDVIKVTGRVAARLPGTENAKLATGDVEVI